MDSLLNYITWKYIGTTNYKSMNILVAGPKDKTGSSIQPISAQCSISIPPENVRKLKVRSTSLQLCQS